MLLCTSNYELIYLKDEGSERIDKCVCSQEPLESLQRRVLLGSFPLQHMY